MGVTPLQAHMFIFYFAIISFITPPVAISAYAASGIAGTNAMSTGFQSFKLGLAGFIVPFLFLYSPSIVLEGDAVHIILNSFTAFLGIMALAGALVGWFLMTLSWWAAHGIYGRGSGPDRAQPAHGPGRGGSLGRGHRGGAHEESGPQIKNGQRLTNRTGRSKILPNLPEKR